MPHLASLPFFVVVENNNNQYVATAFSCAGHNIPLCSVLATKISPTGSKDTWRFGVVTTETTKHAMVRNMMQLCQDQQICVSERFLTTTPGAGGDATTIVQAIREQLKQFAFVSKNVRPAEFQSGLEEKARVHGKASGKTDDMAFALLQGAMYISAISVTPPYMGKYGMRPLRLTRNHDHVVQNMAVDPLYGLVDSSARPVSGN